MAKLYFFNQVAEGGALESVATLYLPERSEGAFSSVASMAKLYSPERSKGALSIRVHLPTSSGQAVQSVQLEDRNFRITELYFAL